MSMTSASGGSGINNYAPSMGKNQDNYMRTAAMRGYLQQSNPLNSMNSNYGGLHQGGYINTMPMSNIEETGQAAAMEMPSQHGQMRWGMNVSASPRMMPNSAANLPNRNINGNLVAMLHAGGNNVKSMPTYLSVANTLDNSMANLNLSSHDNECHIQNELEFPALPSTASSNDIRHNSQNIPSYSEHGFYNSTSGEGLDDKGDTSHGPSMNSHLQTSPLSMQQRQPMSLPPQLLKKHSQSPHLNRSNYSSQPPLPNNHASISTSETTGNCSDTHVDTFDLNGLLPVIKHIDKDLCTLFQGMDLTTLGLDLASIEDLSPNFPGPFAHLHKRREQDFTTPPCYIVPHQQPILEKMTLFSDETLLYIFYTMPRDASQLAASRILHSRDWRYHMERHIWYHHARDSDPLIKTNTYEKGSYVYMDVNTWEEVVQDDVILEYDKLENPEKSKQHFL